MQPTRLLLFTLLWINALTSLAQTPKPSEHAELDAVIKELETNGYEAVKNKKLNLRAIHYVSGTSRLTPEDKQYLDTIATFLTRVPTVVMEIGGHTDNVGNKNANKKLSQDRATAAMQYVVDHGILVRRIRAVGYGSTQPIATNKTEEGRAQNRRVELKFLGLTSDVYNLVTKSGRKIPATYVVVSADGRTISYRENANSPLTRVPASGIDYIEYPDGSRRRPDAIVLSGSGEDKRVPKTTESTPKSKQVPTTDRSTGIGKWLGGKFPKIIRWSAMANGGIAPLSIKQTNIDFAYVDESPSRDNLQSVIQLDQKRFAGVGQIGFEWETSKHWLTHVQYQFGIASGAGFSGFVIGAGKTFGRRSQWVTALDLTLGSAYVKMGELVQNSVYIQVNGTRFDSKIVPVRFRNYYAAFTPQIAYNIFLNENMTLRLTGGYSYSFHTNSLLQFTGKNADGKSVKDSEKLSAPNVTFKIDNARVTDANLFDVRGAYATVGFLYHLYHRSE